MQDVRFVLVRPENGGNVGAAARALKNMGSAALWLVDPHPYDAEEARRLAHGATDILDAARTVATLADAVGDCRWVIGATRRGGRRRAATLTPRALAHAARANSDRRPLALVLGPEADGLSMTDLALCHDVVRIPADQGQPSLNLAQAVLVLAYELFVAELEGASAAPPAPRPEAAARELEPMYAHLETMLLAVRFVRPDTARHRMLALRRILGRARLAPGDVRLVRGICRQVLWAVGRPAAPRNAPAGAPLVPRRAPRSPRRPV